MKIGRQIQKKTNEHLSLESLEGSQLYTNVWRPVVCPRKSVAVWALGFYRTGRDSWVVWALVC